MNLSSERRSGRATTARCSRASSSRRACGVTGSPRRQRRPDAGHGGDAGRGPLRLRLARSPIRHARTNDDRESIFSAADRRATDSRADVLARRARRVAARPGLHGPENDSRTGRRAISDRSIRAFERHLRLDRDDDRARRSSRGPSDYSPTQVKGALIAGGRRIAATRTPGLDVDDALAARPARVNAGLVPSLVLLRLLAESGNVLPDIAWDGISWEGISWESISWEGVAWESVSWEGVTWDGVTWDLR